MAVTITEDHKTIYNKNNNEIICEIPVAENFIAFRPKLKQNLFSFRTICIISIWYLFSFVALFMSKHILDVYEVDLVLFSSIQLAISAFMSYLHGFFWFKKDEKTSARESPIISHDFYYSMGFIGLMRLLVIYLGLMSMKFVALSFMETVKSSAPLFTLLISFIVLKEKNGLLVQLSIFPIMLGLVLCSAFEVSFTWVGFLAAMGANVAECLQFVLSKVFLGIMDPSEFQLHSSIAGLLFTIPMSLFIFDFQSLESTSLHTFGIMMLVGFCYYCQTLMAWILMEFLSPVTHSICNTVKCGVAVWLSIPIFGNFITPWSGFGSFLVITGVIMYQKARSYERRNVKEVLFDLSTSNQEPGLPSSADVVHNING